MHERLIMQLLNLAERIACYHVPPLITAVRLEKLPSTRIQHIRTSVSVSPKLVVFDSGSIAEIVLGQLGDNSSRCDERYG